MTLRKVSLLILCLWLIFALGPVSGQSGSYLDSIYQADSSGTSIENENAYEPAMDYPESSPPPGIWQPTLFQKSCSAPSKLVQFFRNFSISRFSSLIKSAFASNSGSLSSRSSCGVRRYPVTGSCGVRRYPTTGSSGVRSAPSGSVRIIRVVSCGGRRIVIIRRGGCGPVRYPTSGNSGGSRYPGGSICRPPVRTPTAPAPKPVPPSTSPSDDGRQPAPTGDVAALRAEMLSKYGVNAVDGTAQWSRDLLAATNSVLETLPEKFRSHTKNIRRDSMFRSPNILGMVRMGVPTVHMFNGSTRSKRQWEGTLVHEMVHTFQANNRQVMTAWQQQFWRGSRPASSSVSSYGNTQPVEDMAESVRAYWQSGSRMKQSHPDRYEFIRRYVMDGKEF